MGREMLGDRGPPFGDHRLRELRADRSLDPSPGRRSSKAGGQSGANPAPTVTASAEPVALRKWRLWPCPSATAMTVSPLRVVPARWATESWLGRPTVRCMAPRALPALTCHRPAGRAPSPIAPIVPASVVSVLPGAGAWGLESAMASLDDRFLLEDRARRGLRAKQPPRQRAAVGAHLRHARHRERRGHEPVGDVLGVVGHEHWHAGISD